jgi:2-oxoglutarate dehydrogenase E1 component
MWCQEEPKNMGYWSSVFFGLRTTVREIRKTDNVNIKYAGRIVSASPAVASHHRHDQEQAKLVSDALTL